jgi:hypothetical protein
MPEIENTLVADINRTMAIDLPEKISLDEIQQKLEAHINTLIQTDFEKLVSLLYRIDINEEKLKTLLETDADKNAATIISRLIIARQLEKIESRKKFTNTGNETDSERW